MIPLYSSQGEETVFIVTDSDENSNEVHGMHCQEENYLR